MHIDLRLRQVVGQQRVEHLLQLRRLFLVQRLAQMAAEIPFRKQRQLALQQRPIVFGQYAGPAVQLHLHQRVDRIQVQPMRAVGIQLMQVGGGAKIG